MGKGFTYLDQHGERLDPEQVQRCKDLVIPPAWQDVWITPHPNGHLQAVGTDDAGRRQYLYHPHWRASRDAAKFDRILDFGKAMSKARERVLTDIGAEGMSLERACAVAVRLLDLGYFRIGNDVYTDTNGSFGLTTMLKEHVSRTKDGLRFTFVGKSGVEHDITIDDPSAITALDGMRRRRGGGDRLLAWKDGTRWKDLSSRTSTTTSAAASASRPPPRTSAPGTPRSSRPRAWPSPTSRRRPRPRASAPSPRR